MASDPWHGWWPPPTDLAGIHVKSVWYSIRDAESSVNMRVNQWLFTHEDLISLQYQDQIPHLLGYFIRWIYFNE